MKRITGLLVIACSLAACSLAPTAKDSPAVYDFGPARSGAPGTKIDASLMVAPVTAPAWLDTSAVVYRLNHENAARQRTYANSRWAASPAALVGQRLRARLAAVDAGIVGVSDGARADYALRVDLEDFSHVFDSTAASRASVTARVSLVNLSKRALHAQKSFSIERAAATPNAEGGVRALAAGADELVEAIAAWTAASMPRNVK